MHFYQRQQGEPEDGVGYDAGAIPELVAKSTTTDERQVTGLGPGPIPIQTRAGHETRFMPWLLGDAGELVQRLHHDANTAAENVGVKLADIDIDDPTIPEHCNTPVLRAYFRFAWAFQRAMEDLRAPGMTTEGAVGILVPLGFQWATTYAGYADKLLDRGVKLSKGSRSGGAATGAKARARRAEILEQYQRERADGKSRNGTIRKLVDAFGVDRKTIKRAIPSVEDEEKQDKA